MKPVKFPQQLSKNRLRLTIRVPRSVVLLLIATVVMSVYSPILAASDVDDLAECSINVFQEIAETHAWSGHTKGCAKGKVVVEKREAGAFVTTWKLVKSAGSWEKLALSTAVGYQELVDKKLLHNGIEDLKLRVRRLRKCLDSIVESNDPGECRDTAKRVYSVGSTTGFDTKRTIWLDDGGRHVVLGFSYGNSSASDTAPADLEMTPGIPAGMQIDLHQKRGDRGSIR
ncbi:MAG: hypothetical protein WCP20_06160 [Desulfuromonadales bacterium]